MNSLLRDAQKKFEHNLAAHGDETKAAYGADDEEFDWFRGETFNVFDMKVHDISTIPSLLESFERISAVGGGVYQDVAASLAKLQIGLESENFFESVHQRMVYFAELFQETYLLKKAPMKLDTLRMVSDVFEFNLSGMFVRIVEKKLRNMYVAGKFFSEKASFDDMANCLRDYCKVWNKVLLKEL